jgi:RNA polymerase sigma-70 factor (ECF subfamily)
LGWGSAIPVHDSAASGFLPIRVAEAWDDRLAVLRTLDPETLGDHLDRLYRAAWALCGSREDAEDLVQETYERVLRRPRFVRREDDLAYLYRTLRNTYFNARRTASRRPQLGAQLEDVAAASSRADVQPEQAAEINLVFDAVAALPEQMREVLVAVDVLGLSYAEAGQALGVHPNTIPSRLARARLKVAQAVRA